MTDAQRQNPKDRAERAATLTRLLAGEVSTGEAARALALSPRQVRRLRARFLTGAVPAEPARTVSLLPPGLMPIDFDRAQREVELFDLGQADFREPFLHDTVARARREHPERSAFRVSLATFLRLTRLEPGRAPSGLIFHVGRCGSTLLANMLSASPQNLVIKESIAVNAFVVDVLNAGDERRRERESTLSASLAFMFRPARQTERHLLLKLSSWNLALAPTLLRIFPETPAAFVYRDAAAAVRSTLAAPPSWANLLASSRAAQARYLPSLASVPADQPVEALTFYAHAWRSAVEAALQLPPERVALIHYNELVRRPEQVLARLARHFGLRIDADTQSAMLNTLSVYSKDPTGRAGFEPDGTHQRPDLTPDQANRLREIVGDLEERLARRHKDDSGRSAYYP